MAKYGEGDKRWIVEERPDGTNVHNWHWSETNCLDWSRNLLKKLLSDVSVLDGEGGLHIKIRKVESVEGEAYVNVRKGKIIPGYEISVKVSWDGEVRESDGKSLFKVDGTVEIPYIADENADEDPHLKVTVKDEGPLAERLKEAFLAKGRPIIHERVRIFVDGMSKGGPAKDELEMKKPPPAARAEAETRPKQAAAKNPKKRGGGKKGFKTITMTEKFNCRSRNLYEILLDENRWKGFTQSNAQISKTAGGEFTIFDGSVTGKHLELREAKLIVQQWRFASWHDGVYSTVRLELDEPEAGLTVVNLVQTDIPEEDRYGNSTVVENTERGWRDLIFNKIRAVFGFGL